MEQVPLTQGRVAMVDTADYPHVMGRKWMWLPNTRGGYAVRSEIHEGRRQTVYLHRWLLGAQPGQHVDHLNGDGLDNQRANLRLASATENLANRVAPVRAIPYRGVYVNSRPLSPYKAQIKAFRKSWHLGEFADITAAALAYDRAALHFFGAFARLNFPDAIEATRTLPLAPTIQRLIIRDACQMPLPLDMGSDDDFPPVPPTARMDFFEIVHLRDWQAQRALLIPAPNLTALDDLL